MGSTSSTSSTSNVGTRYLDKIRYLKKEKEEKKKEKRAKLEGVQDMSFARVCAGVVVGTVSLSGTVHGHDIVECRL